MSWQENLAPNETPPEWMWAIDDELEKWFDEVEEQRKDRTASVSGDNSDTVVPMMQNQLTKRRRR